MYSLSLGHEIFILEYFFNEMSAMYKCIGSCARFEPLFFKSGQVDVIGFAISHDIYIYMSVSRYVCRVQNA